MNARRRQQQHLRQRHRVGDRRRAGETLADVGRGLPVLHRLAVRGMARRQCIAGIDHLQHAVGQASAHHGRDQFLRLRVVARADDDDFERREGDVEAVHERTHGNEGAAHFAGERLDERVAAIAIALLGRDHEELREKAHHGAVAAGRILIEDHARAEDQRLEIAGRIGIAAVLVVPEIHVERAHPGFGTLEETLLAGDFPQRQRRARHLRVVVGEARIAALAVAPGMIEAIAVAEIS